MKTNAKSELHLTLHTNTCIMRKILFDFIACDAIAFKTNNIDEYRAELAKQFEQRFVENAKWEHENTIMPRELTAENGAKYAFMGAFYETIEMTCHLCDEDDEECEVCNRTGRYQQTVPITWTTIKAIYAKAVEVCEVKELC